MVMQMSDRTIRAAIVGASGFTGAEMLRLVAQHPDIELVAATGDSMAGRRAADVYPSLETAYPDLVFAEFDAAALVGLDLVVLPKSSRLIRHVCLRSRWNCATLAFG